MTATRPRPLVAGNWKMNGLTQGVSELDAVATGVAAGEAGHAEVLICPPFTLIARFAAAAAGQHIKIGAQDCHPKPSGAHTGDVSAEMLKDAGASAVIVGHSERRTLHHESDADVRAKALAARRAGLVATLGEEGHKVRILYGGSVKPTNCAELMSVDNVDGALVGGASLKAADFLGIAAAYSR